MHFVDECQLRVEAGSGGNGCIAFRREKYLPLGGPAGGDGGRGGSVLVVGSAGMTTLADLSHQRTYRADNGEAGGGQDRYGRAAKDLLIRVPLGTMVFDLGTGEKLGELTAHEEPLLVARGGAGGRGNKHFATSTDRAPRRADDGQPGQSRELRLELKVMADVGLLGLPNVGKSTFITTVSKARSKVAAYPFTTLHPHLGVVRLGDWSSGLGQSFVIADIPGLVPGAAEGHGLGSRFLRHVQRTRLLLHLLSLNPDGSGDPLEDYQALRSELEKFDPELARRPEIAVLTKQDLPDVREAYEPLKQRFQAELGKELWLLSSATRHGVSRLLLEVARTLTEAREAAP